MVVTKSLIILKKDYRNKSNLYGNKYLDGNDPLEGSFTILEIGFSSIQSLLTVSIIAVLVEMLVEVVLLRKIY